MSNDPNRWKYRFENFQEALKSMEDVYPNIERMTELEKDGLIQRFEFTFELAWKVMQDYLMACGYKGLKGPRNVIRQFGNDGLLDPFIWQEMMEARNELAHIYDEKKSREYVERISTVFFPVLLQFLQTMTVVYGDQAE
jgi:nucleotidyltransferase substrate binding protein (TIGR01987 family)